jgi:hypothetical protein
MKHIHVVNPYNSIAMQRMFLPFVAPEGLPTVYNMTESEVVDPAADLNYFLPWHGLSEDPHEEALGRKVIAYTHCNPGDEAGLELACARADAIVAMSFQGRRELVNLGVDPAKIHVIYSGADAFSMRRKNIGVIGYEQPNGRKRSHILLDLAWKLDANTKSCINFVVAGQGWDDVVKKMANLVAKVQYFDHLPDDKLQEFYNQLDALIITGYAEGGPLPLLEGLACGLPIFAPPIGYASDFGSVVNVYDSDVDLVRSITDFIKPVLQRHVLARMFTWQDYVMDHGLLFGRLLGETVNVFPEFGMDRYLQLLDVINEIKPTSICEVGAWNGRNAVRMIQEAAKHHPIERIRYTGFDLFGTMTGEHLVREGSKISLPLPVVQSRLKATGAGITLVEGDTNDTLQLNCPFSQLFFIDGGHSYETIANDWNIVKQAMLDGSVAVFDDYYVEYSKEYHAKIGCNAVIEGLDRKAWNVKYLPIRTEIAGGTIILVEVRHA